MRSPSRADGALGLPYLLALDIVCADEPAGPRLRATWTRTAGGLSADDVADAAGGLARRAGELAALPARRGARLTPAGPRDGRADAGADRRASQRASPPTSRTSGGCPRCRRGSTSTRRSTTGELDVYTAQTSLDFLHGIDVERLRAACAALLRRHASLRAGFSSDGLAKPVQFIAREPRTPIEVADLAELEPAERRARLPSSCPPIARAASTSRARRCCGCSSSASATAATGS